MRKYTKRIDRRKRRPEETAKRLTKKDMTGRRRENSKKYRQIECCVKCMWRWHGTSCVTHFTTQHKKKTHSDSHINKALLSFQFPERFTFSFYRLPVYFRRFDRITLTVVVTCMTVSNIQWHSIQILFSQQTWFPCPTCSFYLLQATVWFNVKRAAGI